MGEIRSCVWCEQGARRSLVDVASAEAEVDEPVRDPWQFAGFFEVVEPKLRRALIAAYGHERGREATSEALAWAWEHRDRLESLDNPVRYLYRIGQSRTRFKRLRVLHLRPEYSDPWVEPKLAKALASMPERQRVAVVLAHGYGWTHTEIAELLDIKATTVQNHVERGISHLRKVLEVEHGN